MHKFFFKKKGLEKEQLKENLKKQAKKIEPRILPGLGKSETARILFLISWMRGSSWLQVNFVGYKKWEDNPFLSLSILILVLIL